jgi:hypothetical protein
MVTIMVGTSDVAKAIIIPGPNGVINMPDTHTHTHTHTITTFIHDDVPCVDCNAYLQVSTLKACKLNET